MPIVVKDLTHVYMPGSPFETTALDKVNLTIGSGDFVGLVGHTGSGKSTLVQHLNGLLKPASGQVLVDGQDLWQKGNIRKQVRQKVGLVFQYPEYQLFEETVEKDIAFGPKNLGLSTEEIAQRVAEAMQWVGLSQEDVGARSPFELSGGQKRRVAIAGVLAMRPSVLVLDEPTAGLDPQGREEILRLVERWHARGHTVLMVTHAMDDIARLANRIIIMQKGRVALSGPPGVVFEKEEELRAMGLGVPTATRICKMLKARGVVLPMAWRMDQLSDEIIDYISRRPAPLGKEPTDA